MIAYAAIDLRGGRVVQLVGGRPEDERVSLPDPAAVAQQWMDCGFVALHVVDLDAALGVGQNAAAIDAILAQAKNIPVQVGGGVRSTERVAELLEKGAGRVVVGTRAVAEREWLQQIALTYPHRIVVAADVREDDVVVRGWTASSGKRAVEFLRELNDVPLAAILVTDVSREGQMLGADVARFQQLVQATTHPLIASGGVATAHDLTALAQTGVAGVVLGMALYTGALDARATARNWQT